MNRLRRESVGVTRRFWQRLSLEEVESPDMVGMLVADEHGIQLGGIGANLPQPIEKLPRPKPDINEEAGAGRGKVDCVSSAAASQNP